jgi:hypothetical protein
VAIGANINEPEDPWSTRQRWGTGYYAQVYAAGHYTDNGIPLDEDDNVIPAQAGWEGRLSAMDRVAFQHKSAASMKLLIRQAFTRTIRALSAYWRSLSQAQKEDTWNEAAYAHESQRPGRGGNRDNGWTHMAETEFAPTWYANTAARTNFIDFHGLTDSAQIVSVDLEEMELTYRVHFLADHPPTAHDWIWAYQVYRNAPDTNPSLLNTTLTEEKLVGEGPAGWYTFTVPYANEIQPGDHLRLLVRHHHGVEGVTNHICEYDVPA